MRRLHAPYEGFVGDKDMVMYLPLRTGNVMTQAQPFYDGLSLAFRGGSGGAGTLPFATQSVFDPTMPGTGALQFSTGSNHWFATTTTAPTALQRAVTNATTGWSLAVWYDLTGATSTTGHFLCELATTPDGGTTNARAMGVSWSGSSRSFQLFWRTSTASIVVASATSLPFSGLLGMDVTAGNTQTSWYINGSLISTSSVAVTSAVSLNASSSASARFVLGGSIHQGSNYTTPLRFLAPGKISELAIWQGTRGAARHQALYGQSVRSWDETALFESDNYEAQVRVLIADQDGNDVDLAALFEENWIMSASVRESADDAAAAATVKLRRRQGPFSDISPYTTNEIVTGGVLDLRRRVRIERAFAPAGLRVPAWAWEVRFEGFIQGWDVEQDQVSIDLVDKSAPLNDAFVLDPRAYNYGSSNPRLETVQQQILNDFQPQLRAASTTSVLGYLGGLPTLFTLGGTTASPTLNDSAFNLRYNDVSSGGVFDAVQAVADQIGATTRYVYHEPNNAHRLTTYTPRRNGVTPLQSRVAAGQNVTVTTAEPHRVGYGTSLVITGTNSQNFSGTVASVVDYYTVIATQTSGATPVAGTISTGTTVFGTAFVGLRNSQIQNLSPIRSQMGSIRNHAVVKYQRSTVPDLQLNPVSVVVSGGLLAVTLLERVDRLDPDQSGIAFRIEGCTSTATTLNGSYTGTNSPGSNVILSDVPGAASDGSYSGAGVTSGRVYTDFYRFKQVVSTDLSSVVRFGLLPVGVYEGTTLAINTDAEAQRLADALVADLANPTADLSVTTRPLPLEVHDGITLPDDPKGRYGVGAPDKGRITYSYIVAVEEQYESGRCQATYDLRARTPTLGVGWAERIAIGPGKPAQLDNYPIDMVGQASTSWKLRDAVKRARSFGLSRILVDRKEMGRRHDQTWVWMSRTPNFVPSQSSFVGKFRGDNIQVLTDAEGNALTPGTTYFVRYADQDIWGNLSPITGMGSASTATLPSFTARFLGETASAAQVGTNGGTTSYSAASAWQHFSTASFIAGTDPGAKSYTRLCSFTTATIAASDFGLVFVAPCEGVYSVNHKSFWKGDPLKTVSTTAWQTYARITRHPVSPLVGGYRTQEVVITDAVAGVGSTEVESLSLTASVTCASGDWIRVQTRHGASNAAGPYPMLDSTASSNFYPSTSYALVNQP